jgi:broad specificity phosphatase PhoE
MGRNASARRAGFAAIAVSGRFKGQTLMEIRLVRHGKPLFWNSYEPHTLLSGGQVEDALIAYNNSGILPASRPPKTSLEAAKDAAIAFCSGLRRTVETAAALGVRCRLIEDPLFAEPVVPYGFWKKTKLPLALWFAISQTVWSLGYSLNSEPVARARARAEKAAALLINAAKQNGTVLLVGHSVMNSMIFQALQRRKWKAARPFDGKFWGCNVLVKI